MYFLYNFILPATLALLSPLIFIKLLGDKDWREAFWQRFSIKKIIPHDLADDSPVWFHAASVGEVNASIRLLSEMRKKWPQRKLVVSTFTPTGRKAALEKLDAHAVFFLPIDLSFTIKRAVKEIMPQMLILMETEIWPNLIRECGRNNIPVVIVNGRISDKSLGKYKRLRPLLKEVFCYVSLVLTESEESRKRYISLGANADKVMTTGNLKFDIPIDKKPVVAIEKWDGPIFIAGSTRDEEEDKVLSAYLDARQKCPHLKLILAPRHLHRMEEVEKVLMDKGLDYEKFSGLKDSISAQVLLVDTLGELSFLYPYGDVVFVGGSLVPLGGQNMLEPALCGKPVLFGPHVENFREAARILTEGGGALTVEDSADLGKTLSKLLGNPQERSTMGERAKVSAMEHQGATEKTISELAPLLQ